MKPANGKIIVEVDYAQKQSIGSAGNKIFLAKDYNHNRRESNPVVCKVVDGNGHVPHGTYLLVHHNRFVIDSPHHLEDNLFSLAWNESIFAKLDKNGDAKSLCDNIIVNHVYQDDSPIIPEHLKKPHPTKYMVAGNGYGFKKGQTIFAFPHANYEIVYVFNGVEKRVTKIVQNDIVGKKIK